MFDNKLNLVNACIFHLSVNAKDINRVMDEVVTYLSLLNIHTKCHVKYFKLLISQDMVYVKGNLLMLNK